MEKDTLAMEILHELKATIKRLWITVVILIVLLFGTNLAWLYYWNIPDEEYTISQESSDEVTNNYIGNDGDIMEGD